MDKKVLVCFLRISFLPRNCTKTLFCLNSKVILNASWKPEKLWDSLWLEIVIKKYINNGMLVKNKYHFFTVECHALKDMLLYIENGL